MERSFNAQIKNLEANGAADQIPEQRALFEEKKKELTEIIDHRQRCPNGDEKIVVTPQTTFGSDPVITSVPCQ
jgi:hypothetical protein